MHNMTGRKATQLGALTACNSDMSVEVSLRRSDVVCLKGWNVAWSVRTQVERLPEKMVCPCTFPTPMSPLLEAKHYPSRWVTCTCLHGHRANVTLSSPSNTLPLYTTIKYQPMPVLYFYIGSAYVIYPLQTGCY